MKTIILLLALCGSCLAAETTNEVSTFVVRMPCSVQNCAGEMRSRAIAANDAAAAKAQNKFAHKCTVCGVKANLNKRYPYSYTVNK